jgi:uncharacterized protein (DUF952 family)
MFWLLKSILLDYDKCEILIALETESGAENTTFRHLYTPLVVATVAYGSII